MQRSWLRRFFDPAAVARSEQWFAQKGIWLLLSSRFVPGTRLPTYLAAGFLRLSFGRFLLVTGTAVALWTGAIFGLANVAGPELLNWLQRLNTGGWAVLVLVVAFVVAIRFCCKLTQKNFWRRIRAALGCWARWEFWPAWLFYAPVALNYLRLAIRYRGFTLPTAANPGIFSGGFVGESKIATLRDLNVTSPEFTAEAVLLPEARVASANPLTHPSGALSPIGGEGWSEGALRFAASGAVSRLATLERILREHRIDYPFILKPDVGQRGVGVKLIHTPEQAAAYLQQTGAPLVVQRYIPGPHEAGIFYYRFPHKLRGRIFAITEKIFPTLIGDGERTIEELVWQDERARFVATKYLQRLGDKRTEVPATGETVKLVEAGNHAQGCVFRNGSHLWSEALEHRIDAISQQLDGFFIGRYDIRYSSEDDLRGGRNFQILELNGATSEATNIYDARNSLFLAYRTLFRQWELVFAIGAANRRRGSLPTKLPLLWRKWRETTALAATYPLAD